MRKRSYLLWLAAIAVAAVLPALYYVWQELHIAGSLGFPLDDSWIHLVFARNIAAGDFFSYNSHQHVAGSTSPLWTLVLGVGFAVTRSVFIMPVALGIALNVAAGIMIFKIAMYMGMEEFPSAALAVLVVTATRLVWASVSGMEVSLYVVLTVAAVYYYLRFSAMRSPKKYAAAVLAAMAASARPELFVLPVFFALHQLALRRNARQAVRQNTKRTARAVAQVNTGRISLRDFAMLGAAYLVCIVPFFALNLSLSGEFFPLTLSAKTAGIGIATLLRQGEVAEIVRRFLYGVWVMNLNAFKWIWAQDNIMTAVAIPVVFVAAVVHWWKNGAGGGAGSAMTCLAIVLFLYAPVRGVVTGALDFGQFGRYAAMLTPLGMIFGAAGLSLFLKKRGMRNPHTMLLLFAGADLLVLVAYYSIPGFFGRSHQWPSMDWYLPFLEQQSGADIVLYAAMLLAVTAGALFVASKKRTAGTALGFILLQFCCFNIAENFQVAREFGWNVKNINDTQVALGAWLANNTQRGSVYATNDIGAMAFYAPEDTLVDVMGLVRPEVAAQRAKTPSPDITCLWVLKRFQPQYLICFNEWFPHLIRAGVQSGLLVPVHSVEIRNNMTCGGPGVHAMYVYRVNGGHLAEVLQQAGVRF